MSECPYLDSCRHLKALQERVTFLEKRCAQLERELHVLRASLTGEVIKAEKTFRDMEDKFARLDRLILRVVIDMCKRHKAPVHQDKIVKAFRTRYPSIDCKDETIQRRLRKLREEGYLHSPIQGHYVPKAIENV